jgi:DNA-directed RNA polymerase subunit RPC12/RpoP
MAIITKCEKCKKEINPQEKKGKEQILCEECFFAFVKEVEEKEEPKDGEGKLSTLPNNGKRWL